MTVLIIAAVAIALLIPASIHLILSRLDTMSTALDNLYAAIQAQADAITQERTEVLAAVNALQESIDALTEQIAGGATPEQLNEAAAAIQASTDNITAIFTPGE